MYQIKANNMMPRKLMTTAVSILFLPSSTLLQTSDQVMKQVASKESTVISENPMATWNEMMREYSAPKTSAAPEAAQKRRMRVVSDVHIGGCWSSNKQTQNNFMLMLRGMALGNPASSTEPPLTHLVLLGDLFDWWVVPLTEPTPHPTILFKSQDAYGYDVTEIISLIKQIGEHTKVYLVRGNHDDVISKDLVETAFGDSVQFMEDGFELDGVWLEHGNIIDLYSSPPLQKNEVRKKGFAYFVTRAGADEDGWQCKHNPKKADDHKAYVKFARKSIEHLLENPLISRNRAVQNWYFKNVRAAPHNFAPSHLQGVLKMSNPSFTNSQFENIFVTGMNSRGDQVLFDSNLHNYTLDDAVKDHASDLDLWAEQFGSQHTLARVYASGFENHFKWAPLSQKHLVLVTGHTHNPYMTRLPRASPRTSVSDDVIYVNSGSFAQDSFGRDHSSFIDIIFEQIEHPSTTLVQGTWRPQAVKYFEYPHDKPQEELTVPMPRNQLSGLDLFLHPDKSEMVIKSLS